MTLPKGTDCPGKRAPLDYSHKNKFGRTVLELARKRYDEQPSDDNSKLVYATLTKNAPDTQGVCSKLEILDKSQKLIDARKSGYASLAGTIERDLYDAGCGHLTWQEQKSAQ